MWACRPGAAGPARRMWHVGRVLPDPAPLKAIRVERLRGEAAVLRRELREQRVVGPVGRVDDVDVVAGPGDPAEARLPAGHATHGVVLNVVHPRDERRELQTGADPIEPGRKGGLR